VFMKRMGFDRTKPLVAITNAADRVKNKDAERVVRALQKQIDEHFAPAWGFPAELVFNQQPLLAMKIMIKDRSADEDAGFLGYHFVDGLPVTVIFAEDDIAERGEYSSTLSHELLEMISDPGVNLYSLGYYRDKAGRRHKAFIPYEVCDPVEANTYKIDGVVVSNFVLPEWFEPEHEDGAMQMDHLGVLDSPFQLAPGGYIDSFWNGKTKTIWGEKTKKKKVRHRLTGRQNHIETDLAGARRRRK
jgi:hypothetical protein